MPERSDRHGWIDLLVPDGPFLSAAALDVQTVGENWPTRLSAEQRSLLTAPPASEAEEGEGWDDSSWDGRRARVTELLTELLGYREGKTLAVAPGIAAHHHIYRARVSADFVIHAPDDQGDARMVVICGPDATDDPSRLDPARTHTHDGWVSTPVQRAALLARHANADLALVTNGREHLLVNVVTGTTGSAMWTVNGLEDRHARDALVALLHKQRVLHRTVPLSKLIELSQDRQHELTDTLGKQVRRAAEALVNAISRANRTSRGRLLEGLTGQQVYAATTRVLMRTVFLLVAEERGLLPVAENQLFADQYAMSTLLDKLEEDAYRNRSAMERRAGAWQRMMALSRAVHAGIEHDDLRLPAYGGNLFDPDEHPFLEARVTAGDGEGFEQLDVGVVDDFTVLTMLRHLQIADGQRISFRSLDVEQIGHVYEALLDHSAVIVPEDQVAVLGLIGKAGNEPEVSLVELEGWTAKSDKELGKQLVDLGVAAEAKGIYQAIDDGLAPDNEVAQTLNVAVANDASLRERVDRYAPLLRTDARGVALVFRPGDVYVTETSSKRDSGTAYTPRSLAEEIAKHTLDPLIYDPGPQNEPDETNWKLKTAEQILDLKICDPAVGSAAILVAAVRYLAEALLQAQVAAGRLDPARLAVGGQDVENLDARVAARREVVNSVIHGVDRDPMAVEMAKLSLWLVTMARDRPFTFLDHAIRHGDSLLGLASHDDLARLSLVASEDVFGTVGGGLLSGDSAYEWRETIAAALRQSVELRTRLKAIEIRDAEDTDRKAALHRQVLSLTAELTAAADGVVGSYIVTAGDKKETAARLARLSTQVSAIDDPSTRASVEAQARANAETDNPNPSIARSFLHWPIAFPEVFERDRPGFDAMLANPPYIGNKYWKGRLGSWFQSYFERLMGTKLGKPDLMAVFIWRMTSLVRRGGTVGTLSTQSISEVASKTLMEKTVLDNNTIFKANRSQPWPGEANVFVSMLWLMRGDWGGASELDGDVVDAIAGDLRAARELPEPIPLKQHALQFEGVHNGKGMAFVLDASHPLVRDDFSDVVKPYLSGTDLTQSNPLQPERYVIDLTGFEKGDVDDLPAELRRYVFDVVAPTRTPEDLKSYKGLADRWWTFWNTREDLFAKTRKRDTCLVGPSVAKYWVVLRLPSDWVYTNMVAVIDESRPDLHAILQSALFDQWLLQFGGSLGKGRRMKTKAVVNTFPLPDSSADDELGGEWQSLLIGAHDELGPATDVLNQVHDPAIASATVIELRRVLEAVTASTLAAYGWHDIDSAHEHHETVEGVRWTVGTSARSEILKRLVQLNHERARAGR